MENNIEFKGISKSSGNWVYGSYWQNCATGATIITGDGSSQNDFHLVEKESVRQFTGYTDIFGIKIYVGDMLEWEIRGQECFGAVLIENGCLKCRSLLNNYYVDPVDYKLCKNVNTMYEFFKES